MVNIKRKDIGKEKSFTKNGITYVQTRHNPETGWYLYDRGTTYEVVKLKKYRNPDGEEVLVYPSDEDWGHYGYTVMKNRHAEKLIDFLMSAKSRSPQEIYEFKKGL